MRHLKPECSDKDELREHYEAHTLEKDLSHVEKAEDKVMVSDKCIVTCYDLHGILHCPKDDVSLFIAYKNLTPTTLQSVS